MTICNADHCPDRAREGSRYCDTHQRERGRAKSKRRGYSAHAAGYDAGWTRTARRVLRKHPTCNRCPQPSTEVHHIDGLGPSGPHGHDETNLEALCHECHSAETARRQQISGWMLGGELPDGAQWTPGDTPTQG